MLSSNASGESIRSSKCDVAGLYTSRHIVCFGCRVDDLVYCLHSEIERHELALSKDLACSELERELGEHTTGCRPASAAPTVRPQKPDSVIGLSMTLFSPNRSSNPFVTLYLFSPFISNRLCRSCIRTGLCSYRRQDEHSYAGVDRWREDCHIENFHVRSIVLCNFLPQDENFVIGL